MLDLGDGMQHSAVRHTGLTGYAYESELVGKALRKLANEGPRLIQIHLYCGHIGAGQEIVTEHEVSLRGHRC